MARPDRSPSKNRKLLKFKAQHPEGRKAFAESKKKKFVGDYMLPSKRISLDIKKKKEKVVRKKAEVEANMRKQRLLEELKQYEPQR
jgi:hypothetical protein